MRTNLEPVPGYVSGNAGSGTSTRLVRAPTRAMLVLGKWLLPRYERIVLIWAYRFGTGADEQGESLASGLTTTV